MTAIMRRLHRLERHLMSKKNLCNRHLESLPAGPGPAILIDRGLGRQVCHQAPLVLS